MIADDYFCAMCNVDAEGKRGSRSRESTPLHPDWPPVSLSAPLDQSQDAHLSREPGGAAEAGQLDASSCLTENKQFLGTKDSNQALEPLEVELSSRTERVEDQLIPDNVLSSPPGVVETGSQDTQSTRVLSQETRTTTIERRSLPSTLDDVSGSGDGVQLSSWSAFSQFRQVRLDTGSQRHETSQETTERVSTDGLGDRRLTDVSAQVQSYIIEGQAESDSLLPSYFIQSSAGTDSHQRLTSGSSLHSASSSISFFLLSSVCEETLLFFSFLLALFCL